ncbi:AvrE-family type 3 secretion system effector [Erwiniaceae bacterium BAC15a-03b]|uniref:AvrE-family type 3 secretion system effector n=1 Tax=Winslowiella arboricola TaxID=2978220 RepID=A0A9J6PJB5_9GAMM|nr:AvrE-family type 3 secretion system effector [Winslowiella arboricola]MCU5773684.1 AvrE-family type 3 secretion system effector [Winslowiella arboricola]MCU5778417.1 AvrE-family type 3 secretion system effector [Winslowiella arboricola]
MPFKLPLLVGNRAMRGAQARNPQTPSIPLRQMSARSRQNAGGSLQQDGLSSQPAPPLRQQNSPARQSSGCGLRSSLTRLRERLQSNGNKLQKRPGPQSRHNAPLPPPRPEENLNTAQFTRSSARPQAEVTTRKTENYTRASTLQRTPGAQTRPPASPPPDVQTRPSSGIPPAPTRASAGKNPPGVQTRPSASTTPPKTPAATQKPSRRETLANAVMDTIAELPELEALINNPPAPASKPPSPLLEQAQGQRPEHPTPPISEKARGKQPEGTRVAPQQTRQAATPPKLDTIEEEKFNELERSKLNQMQQVALDAAERDTAEHKNLLRPQIAGLARDDNGKLTVTDAVSDNLRNILNETVARPRHTYKAHQASDDNSQHLLLDDRNRLLSLQGSKTAFIGLTQSLPVPDSVQDHHTLLLNTLTPGEALHSQLTGIFSHDREEGDGRVKDLVSEQLREHGGRLYRLDEKKMHWDQVDKDEEKSFSKLTKQPNGMLYAIHDSKTLYNLSTGGESEKFKQKITSYCTNEQGNALLLLKDEKTAKQSVQFLSALDAESEPDSDRTKAQSIALKTQQGETTSDFHATGITLHNNQLFAIGSNGKLYSSAAPKKGDKELVLQQDSEKSAQLAAHLGEKYSVESFVNHGDGKLLALVKDASNERHACSLDASGAFRPDWNLSASLVMDHHEGLLRPRPLPQDNVDLGRLGQVMIHDGKINAFNKNSQRWEASFESADNIKRGQDGQAYVLKDGIASRVKVSLKSDSIGGSNHQFTMRQMKSNLSLDEPLVGINSQNKASAIAPLDADRFVALSENGELQFHRNLSGSRQPEKLMHTLTKDGIDNWLPESKAGTAENMPASGVGNTLTDVAMDPKQSLYTLDEQGKLYTMPKDHWQNRHTEQPAPGWQPVPLPDGLVELASLHNAADGSLMVADKDGRSAILQLAGRRLNATVKQGENAAGAASNPAAEGQVTSQNAKQVADADRWLVQPDYDPNKKLEAKSHRRRVEKAWERLDDATKSTRVMGMTMKREANLLGMTGRDGNHINSRLRDRLRAHVFNPTLATPRPIKNASYHIQHDWKGREGLRPLYQHQGALHSEMKTLIAAPAPAVARTSLQDRLAALEGSSFNKALIENLKTFSDGVADSARHQTSLLGQHSGALQPDRTATKDFSPSRLNAFTQALNINSDDSNLVNDLSTLYQRYPMRAENDSHTLMDTLQNQGVVVRHQKQNPPMSRQRDPFDDMGLSKSRLILDGVTMSKLHEMLDEMEGVAGDDQAIAANSKDLQERFRVLRDETYGEDPIRKTTSQGFVSNKHLEACYDSVKSMTNAFSKPHHGINMTTRTVLKAKDQDQMTERLHRTITSLEPGENMGFDRSYGGLLTLSVIPGGEVIGIPGLRGNLDRAYNASFSRGDSGITVSFSRNGGGTGTAFGAVGWNPMSEADDYKDIKVDLGDNNSIIPSARLGGMIAMALQRQMQNSISFTISEAELQPFIKQMTSGELNPQQLIDRGVGQRMKHGTTLNFNVDATLLATAGGALSLPIGNGDSSTVRGTVIAQAGVNLASAQRDRNVTRSDGGQTNGRSDNRMRFLNNASAGAGIGGGAGITTNAASNLRVPVFGVSTTNIQVSIDNRTKQSMSIDMAKAEAPEQRQLDKLLEQIGLNFDDAELNKLVQEIKDADKPPKKPEVELSADMKTFNEQRLRGYLNNPDGKPTLSKDDVKKLDALEKKQLEGYETKAAEEAKAQASGGAVTVANSDEAAETKPAEAKKKAFNTSLLPEKQAVKQKLEKLTSHLEGMTPANNGQYGVINSAKQLRLQQQAADLRCQAMNSAEYQTTYNNLHKIDSNNLMHVLHSLIASELPASNAERISQFMAEKPMLKEVIRDLQKHSDTQAVVTLEMKDNKKFETQQLWLDHRTQPQQIEKLLKDRNNLRIKSIGFTETNNKPEGINIPLLVTGWSSKGNVSMSRNLGKINFSYGEDQETPHSFSLEGEIAYASQDVVNALTNAEVQDKRGVV